jgi:hypothetical protein
MKRSINIGVCLLLSVLCLLISVAEGADKIKFQSDPQQRLDVRFRLFRTDNMWSYLLLDTSDGRLWHVTYTTDEDKGARLKVPINDKALVTIASAKNGRFTLYPTDNMWNFLLLDQDDGGVWQCQFTMQKNNFCLPLPDISELINKTDTIQKENNSLKSEQSCEEDCRVMIRMGKLREGLTLQECVKSLCK